jgi:transposase
MLTFKFQLYPNKNQQEILWKHANKLNNLYNYFLNQRIENYKLNIKISRKDQQKELVSLKNNDSALQEIHSQVLQQIPLRLDKAYKNFFRKKLMKYWLLKTEPQTFSIDDLEKEKKTIWSGVRNYQVRNLIRDEIN